MNLKLRYEDLETDFEIDPSRDKAVGYIGDPRDDFMVGIIGSYIEKYGKVVIHDTHGMYREGTPTYANIGHEFKANILEDPDIFIFTLKGLVDYLRLKYPYWEVAAHSSIRYFLKTSDEPTIDNYINYIMNKSVESTGIEKSSYMVYQNLLLGLLDPSSVLALSTTGWTRLRDDSAVFIGYRWLKSYISRIFVSTVTFLNLVKQFPGHIHVLLDSSILSRMPVSILRLIIDKSVIILQAYSENDMPISIMDKVFINQFYVGDYGFLDRAKIPLREGIDKILLFDRSLYLPVTYYRVLGFKGGETVHEVDISGVDYLEEYRDIVHEILELLHTYGEMTLDGIYINISKGDKALVTSIVTNLWREGYIRRMVGRGGVKYMIDVNGIKLLRRLRGDAD